MDPSTVEIVLNINRETRTVTVSPDDKLRDVLRKLSYFSVKHGCEDGTCGTCTVLLDGKAVHSCLYKAINVVGKEITTLEGITADGSLHPLQKAFMEAGAAQCGYCTPGHLMTAKALLDNNPNPSDDEIRGGMNGVLCRCTGYVHPVDAIRRAAAEMRGEPLPPVAPLNLLLPENLDSFEFPEAYYRRDGSRQPLPPIVFSPKDQPKTSVIGSPEVKLDAEKLVRGKPVYTDDIHMEGMLYAALLTSPHAHARIKRIDASRARALPGVRAVLTCSDLLRVKYISGGQSYPQPPPFDQVSLDNKVRYVGDRVAVVAADTLELANQALELIDVEYEILPAVLDPLAAMQPGAPVIHDEPDTTEIYDREHNIAAHFDVSIGDAEKAFAEADFVYSGEYHTHRVQHAHLEPHVCITWWDENQRLNIRTSTQVPYHVRRLIAPLIGLPVKRIRVFKPRIGGGFGNKQEMVIEDLCAHLTIATGKPVRMELTRDQEFSSTRTRHPEIMRFKIGVKSGKVSAVELHMISDTGAYGTHGATTNIAGAYKGLSLYNPPNVHYVGDIVYTNLPVSGAFRGYGAMQCLYGMEVIMAEVAEKLGVDEVEFKRNNWVRVGDDLHLAVVMGEGREGTPQTLLSSGMDECLALALKASEYEKKRGEYATQSGGIRKGIGMAVVLHGSGIGNMDMGSASIKMNDDGSFNLLVGATDSGSGADTILAQIAAEQLGIPIDDLIVTSGDTDFTPFDKGAYASSTTYVSGGAVLKAAREVARQIREHAALMLGVEDPSSLTLRDRKVLAPDGRSLTLEEVALSSLHVLNQHQIQASASNMSPLSPPPTAAQIAEISVDTATGKVKVERLLMVVDCGTVINPITAAGQVEGGMAQAMGFALTEEMLFDADGKLVNGTMGKYKLPRYKDMPTMDVMLVQTHEPSGPYGAKSIGELAIDGVAPAVASAIHNATGFWLRDLPYTPEKVLKAIQEKK
jgi:putative selenate reductase molybdopterin-binding subunit